jgi:hypothetical protein
VQAVRQHDPRIDGERVQRSCRRNGAAQRRDVSDQPVTFAVGQVEGEKIACTRHAKPTILGHPAHYTDAVTQCKRMLGLIAFIAIADEVGCKQLTLRTKE